MSIKASEISDLIGQRIQNFAAGTEARNVGNVMSVADGVVRIHGLADARYGEMLEFPGNLFGLALNLEQDSVGAVVLGEYKSIREGDVVKTTGRILEVPVGPELLGRVVDVAITSAAPMGAGEQAQLAAALEQRFSRKVRVQTAVDPTLIGGAVLRAGDLTIDGSVKARLARLAQDLTA